eukprot:5022523-Amphidinium_carterae.1
MKNAGLTEAQINQAYDYFDEKTSQHFNVPNLRNVTEMQHQLPKLRERREGSHQGYSEIDNEKEDDNIDEYDISHPSEGTTRASENITRKPMIGRGKTTEQRPRPGSIVTNLLGSTTPRLRTSRSCSSDDDYDRRHDD